ncbi:MAG: hypothetical protein IPG76_21350 [Acidobacteria bacterium]|nr:hypothetical protein [Acidobacteriota bacterium]
MRQLRWKIGFRFLAGILKLVTICLVMICPTFAQSDKPSVRNKEIELEFGSELQQIAPGCRTTGVIPVPRDAPEPFLALGIKWLS